MTQHFYIDADNNFVGSIFNPQEIPDGWHEVPSAPLDARQKWLGHSWSKIPIEVPSSITNRQGKLKLIELGLLTELEALIEQIPDPTEKLKLQVEYNNHVWERANEWIDLMGAKLNLTSAQIDQLFIEAKEIT